MHTLNLIGAGRVGRTLAHLWHRCGALAIGDVHTRSLASAQAACAFVGAGRAVERTDQMQPADVWMLAVPDAQIASAAHALAQCAREHGWAPAQAFHCSGALASDVLQPLQALGWQVASTHCILSFASAETAVEQFAGTPCALEGDHALTDWLRGPFGAIGARCFDLQADKKVLYHAAAVFATNYLPVLEHLAETAWADAGVPAELLPGLRQNVMARAMANVQALGPQGALTGPAARRDVAAIARQRAVVAAWDAQAGEAYAALSALALRMANQSSQAAANSANPR
jgi:predicted short-subunit dehydrogenase-like oxidoreductase (DUF2520 family)